jgi:predicted dehydrogenase
VDYYANREWYDNVLAILEYDTPQGVVRASYQVLTTTSARGYYETFMGLDGTMQISEVPGKCRLYSEGSLAAQSSAEHPWMKWVARKYIIRDREREETRPAQDDVLAVTYSPPPIPWLFPQPPADSLHGPHLANFFDAIRNGTPLNCPAEVGYANMATVLKINEAVAAGRPVECKADDFSV